MSTKKQQIEMLSAVPLFTGLSQRELRAVASIAKLVRHDAGVTIVEQGAIGVGFHLVVEGRAKVGVNGRNRATLGPGDYFGEISLIDGGPRTATVRSETPLTTLSIATWDFMSMLRDNWAVTRKLLIGICARLREERSAFSV